MKITKRCPVCKKICEVKQESKLTSLNLLMTEYSCGHTRTRRILEPKDFDITSSDGKKPFKYQLEGAAWCLKDKTQVRVLIADEMGVGKTLQAGLVAYSDTNEFLPILVICKPGLKFQMQQEFFRWFNWLTQIIDNENEYILPAKGYIIGYETLTYSEFRNKRGKLITRGIKDLSSFIDKLGARLVILDECQQIKNKEAKRTKAIQFVSQQIPHAIALSGTPILNNAKEYFPVLNMLQPEKFPFEQGFISRWCDSYFSMKAGVQKIGGIKDIPGWKRFTQDFIIRRTRAEVLPDLPTVDRRFRFEELGAKVEEAYKAEFKKFKDCFYGDDDSFAKQGEIMAFLSKMRHLTGIAKIPGVTDFIEEFIADTDRKIVIFTHHIDVAQELYSRIKAFHPNCIYAPSPVDHKLINLFVNNPENRVLIGNTLSLGEGFNLQCASECIQMEPEWNPGKEEQAESRFPRPGQLADKITATSFIAVGTIDEFFSELKEQKRAIFQGSVEFKEGIKWNESSLIKELTEVLASKGGQKWGW